MFSNPRSWLRAVSAPLSIMQQRLLMVTLVALVTIVVSWLNGRFDYSAPIIKVAPPQVAEEASQLAFMNAESSWSYLEFDDEGQLIIDGRTESALIDAIALLHYQTADSQIERMSLLLEKQYGARRSQQILELLPVLKNYKEIEQDWWKEHAQLQPVPHDELFALQDQVLGKELAGKLFSEQRRLMQLMIASNEIENNPELNEEQKQHALMKLNQSFQEAGVMPQ